MENAGTLIKSELSCESKDILKAIEEIKRDLECSKKNFDFATNEVLIDSYIYEITALNKKYQYFLQLAKKRGLVAEGFERIG